MQLVNERKTIYLGADVQAGLLSVSICVQEETDDYLFGALKVRQRSVEHTACSPNGLSPSGMHWAYKTLSWTTVNGQSP
ncbi:hypothetical protein JZ751_012795 [Albula glossodonta]|uniref:Uncharacterized protein n=1 Tax=Albula glossodonta TaxID=121402 RepID=A0A8T2MYD3_9TELE|nr:hypothetical protein JZ751_012795 [Albula glossodonta]